MIQKNLLHEPPYFKVIKLNYFPLEFPNKLNLLQSEINFDSSSQNLNKYQMIREYDYVFKVVAFGSPSVGKTSVLRRLADMQFQEDYSPTIGADFYFKTQSFKGIDSKLQLWDTTYGQRYRSVTRPYCKMADAIIIVYSVINQFTLRDVKQYWIKQVQRYRIQNVVVLLVGNKIDLRQCPVINHSQLLEFCAQNNIQHIQVSAKTGQNINNISKAILQKLSSRHLSNKNQTKGLNLKKKSFWASIAKASN